MKGYPKQHRFVFATASLSLATLFLGSVFSIGKQIPATPGTLRATVDEFKIWQQEKNLAAQDRASIREWRDRLVAGAEADLSDGWAARALVEAAGLSNALGEKSRAMSEYETVVTQTTNDDTVRGIALLGLVRMAEAEVSEKKRANIRRDDLLRVIEAWDRYAAGIQQMSPENRRGTWERNMQAVPLNKAMFLLSLAEACPNENDTIIVTMGGPNPTPHLPPCDPLSGLAPSGLIEDYINNMRAARSRGDNLSFCNGYRLLGRAYATERKNRDAYDAYLKMLDDPKCSYSAPQIAVWACEALDPTHGSEFRYHAEQLERRFAEDSDRRRITWEIARSYFSADVPRAYIDRMAPIVASSDPEDVEWLSPPGVRATVLHFLASAYQHRDIAEYDNAAEILREIIRTDAVEGFGDTARRELNSLVERGLVAPERSLTSIQSRQPSASLESK